MNRQYLIEVIASADEFSVKAIFFSRVIQVKMERSKASV